MGLTPGPGQNANRLPDDRRATVPDPDNPTQTSGGADDKPGFRTGAGDNQLSGGVDVAEYIDVMGDPDEPEITETEDGGADVKIGEAYEHPQGEAETEFYANLADGVIPDSIQSRVITDLVQKVEMDKESRKKRDEQYEEGLRRTGLGKDAPGGAQFEGASKVVHPMITEACIDYESRIIKELWPIAGPAKAKIIGVVTPEKTQRAERKVAHMNYQLTEQIKEARAVAETTFTQVPLGGVQYIHQWWDHRLERPRWAFVPVDDVYLPFSAADFQSSHRWTYKEMISGVEYKHRVQDEVYRDLDLPAPSQLPDPSKTQEAANKIEGREDPGLNLDGEREIWNTMAYLEITEDMAAVLNENGGDEEAGRIYPYLMSIDVSSHRLLSLCRNWEKDDEAYEPIAHLFEFPFIPWRGALAIGFPQIIGGLSGAATGALRALLDSAHANNSITAYVLKGTGFSGTSNSPQIGEMVEIDGGLETDDIRKRVMAPPFNPPSTVLFQLLGFLVDAAKGTVRTSMDEAAIDSNSNVPVGTQLSRVEEGLVVFSGVHGRAHTAFNRLLAGLHRLNRMYLPDELKVNREGTEVLVRRKDYEGPCDVQPVSEPTIYSDQQRFAQILALEQSAAAFPNMFDMREIQKRKLKLWKISDIDAVLKPEPKPQEMNAVNENLAMTLGRPTAAFPEQNHLAHLITHLDFIQSPMFGMNQIIAPTFLPLAIKHCTEHMALLYVHQTIDMVKQAAGVEASELMSNDPKVKAEFDKLLAQASTSVLPQVDQLLQQAMPILQAATALMQQLAPKPPVDPAVLAASQAAQAETARKTADDQATQHLEAVKAASDERAADQANELKQMQTQLQMLKTKIDALVTLRTNKLDSETALTIANGRVASGQKSTYTDGASLSS